MENSIVKEITQKGLETYFKARTFEAMYWATFFPLKNVMSLSVTTLIGEQGGRVAADVISFDASAPLKTRQVVGKMQVEIPKIAVKRKMSETAILEYTILAGMANPAERQILDLVYEDLDFVVQSVNARMEWLALKALSATKIVLNSTNNQGIVTEEAVDYLMPDDNKSGALVIWSTANAATMKPIDDFKAIVSSAREEGKTLAYALMDPNTFDVFTGSTQAQDFAKTYGGLTAGSVVPFMSVDYINTALRAARLPEIRVIDQSIITEERSGVQTKGNPWDTNYVTFLPDVPVGNMLNGPIAEELRPPKQVLQSKSGNVLVSKYSVVDPLAEFTKGEANAFPAWKTVANCYSLKRTATTWS